MIKTNIQGIEVNFIPATKFKHMMVVFTYQSKLDFNTYNERHMLPTLLEQNNQVYKDTESYHTHLDMLYGARFNTGVFQRGDMLLTQFSMRFINQKYVNDSDDLIASTLTFLHNIIYKPKLYRGLLTKKAVSEKLDETYEMINTIHQDKASLAYYKLLKHISGDKYPTFFPEESKLDQVSSESLTRVYHQLVEDDELKIYVVGDVDVAHWQSVIEHIFSKPQVLKPQTYELNVFMNQKPDQGIVVENEDVSISRIYLGYQIHINHDNKAETMMELFSVIVGGYSQSKLFKTIREEMHLVYFIYSTYLTENDMFIIHFECEDKDMSLAIKESKHLIDLVKSGDISEDELYQAKMQLIKNYLSMSDGLSGLLKLNMTADIIDNDIFDIDQKIATINAITVSDLVALANDLKPYITYQFIKDVTKND